MTTHRSTLAALALTTALVGAAGVAPPPASAEGPLVFHSQGPITIPNAGNATPYPSTIQVSGLTAPISDVDVTLSGLTQDCMNDLAVLLVSPTGEQSLLMADLLDFECQIVTRRGAQNVNLTFDDAAAGPVPNPVVSGTYRPTDGNPESPNAFPPPAPEGGQHPTPLSAFNGISGNGTWSLYVRDVSILGGRADTEPAGSVGGGWGLSITTTSTRDTTAPDTAITKRPTYRHPRHSRFKVTATEAGATFRCRLDAGPVEPCGPKVDFVGLKKGKHTLTVYAVDAAGNADATPASATWKVWRRGTGHQAG